MPARSRRIGSAHVLAATALFVALGGTSIAQDAVKRITGKNVRDGSLTGRDVRNRSLTGADVRNRSLTAADLARGVVRNGAPGPSGPAGPRGERGPTGPAGPDLAGATHVRVRGDRTATENGAALRAALAGITDASSARPYVVQLAPGVYELGGTTLAMKPDVSIVGPGAAATRITGDQAQQALGEALMLGADRTLLRGVTVTNRGTAAGPQQGVVAFSGGGDMRIEDAVLESLSSTVTALPLQAVGASTTVELLDSRVEYDAPLGAAANAADGAVLRIRGSDVVARGGNSSIGVSAGGVSAVVVEHSAMVTTGPFAEAGLSSAVTIGASRVDGTTAFGDVTCVASYDEDFVAVDASCA
jgi:hypothetical protein